MENSIAALSFLPIAGFLFCISFVIFQILWMIKMKRIAKANTEYTLMQVNLFMEYFKSKGFEADLQKINEETAKQINEGKDFNGVSDLGYKI